MHQIYEGEIQEIGISAPAYINQVCGAIMVFPEQGYYIYRHPNSNF